MLTEKEIMMCSCRGEAHDECRPCADCDQQPALNDVVDDPDGGVMYLCDDCYEERVEAEEQRIDEDHMRRDMEMLGFDLDEVNAALDYREGTVDGLLS